MFRTAGRQLPNVRLGEEKALEIFAAKLGVSRQNLSDIESERRGVSVERAAAWADKLGYDRTHLSSLQSKPSSMPRTSNFVRPAHRADASVRAAVPKLLREMACVLWR